MSGNVRAVAALSAFVGWAALTLQAYILIGNIGAGPGLWRFLGFFTILANIGAAVVASAIAIGSRGAFTAPRARLMAVTRISSGRDSHPTPTGIFAVLGKKTMHHSKKYENAPMPFTQFIDQYGIALHAGANPGRPASHGCVRLPNAFAKKLFSVTDVGTPVYIGA